MEQCCCDLNIYWYMYIQTMVFQWWYQEEVTGTHVTRYNGRHTSLSLVLIYIWYGSNLSWTENVLDVMNNKSESYQSWRFVCFVRRNSPRLSCHPIYHLHTCLRPPDYGDGLSKWFERNWTWLKESIDKGNSSFKKCRTSLFQRGILGI